MQASKDTFSPSSTESLEQQGAQNGVLAAPMGFNERFASKEGHFATLRTRKERYFARPLLSPRAGTKTIFYGKECIQWSTNNYLGLAENEDMKMVATEVVKEYGLSAPMGSRMMTGNTESHEALEKELADFVETESSMVFNCGYLGVFGTLSAILQPQDIVIMDKQSHACMFDGVHISGCQVRYYRHNDMNHLESLLKWADRNRKKAVLILTEGVFGMRGDVAPLPEIYQLKTRYDASLFVDDAHGFGVMGEAGQGTPSLSEKKEMVDFYYGTFSKAFASLGGMVASTTTAVDWLAFNSRANVFTKSLPLAYVRVISKALEIVRSGTTRRKQLFANAAKLKTGLRGLGFTLPDVPSPITAVFLKFEHIKSIQEFIIGLRERGVFVTGVIHPVVPKDTVCIRMIPTATHTEAEIDYTLETIKLVRDKVRLNQEPPKV